MSIRRLLRLATTLLAVSLPLPASSATITLDDPAFAFLASSSTPNPLSLAGNLPAFDPGFGTLTGVSLRVIGVGSAFLTLNAPQAGYYSGPLAVTASLLDSSNGVLGSASAYFGTIHGVAAGAGPVLLQDGNSWLATIDITSGFAAFLIADAYSVRVGFSGSVSGPGLLSQPYVADSFDGSVIVDSVAFTYTPVPEPSTALLVGVGLLGLALRRPRASR